MLDIISLIFITQIFCFEVNIKTLDLNCRISTMV